MYMVIRSVMSNIDESLANLSQLKNKIDSLTTQRNDLIIRISGLSDWYLQDQAQQEYQLLNDTIEELETSYVHMMFLDIADRYRSFYREQFRVESDVITAIELSNSCVFKPGELHLFVKRQKLRVPNTLDKLFDNYSDARRLLLVLATALDRKLCILDMASVVIDELGNGNSSSVHSPIILYVSILDKIQDYGNVVSAIVHRSITIA
jgi:hypothetical protein